MRTHTRIFLCVAVSLSFAATCAGQQSKRSRRRTTQPQTRPAPPRTDEIRYPTIRTTGRVVSPDEVRQIGQAQIMYYRGRDETTVSTGGEVYREPPTAIELLLHFRVSGKVVARPEAVTVEAMTNGRAVFTGGLPLVIEADGRRHEFSNEKEVCSEKRCVNVSARVDFATFEQIANSKNVKVHAAQYTFDLNEAGREALRDMLRVIEAPAKEQ